MVRNWCNENKSHTLESYVQNWECRPLEEESSFCSLLPTCPVNEIAPVGHHFSDEIYRYLKKGIAKQ